MRVQNNLLASFLGAALMMARGQINDDFENAVELSGIDTSGSGTNSDASRQRGEPGLTGEATLWWSWIAPTVGLVTIGTDASTFDTMLSVFVGSSWDRLSVVAANNDTPTARTSRVAFQCAAEETYHIAVGVNGIPFGRGHETSLHVSLEPNAGPKSVVGSETFSERSSLTGEDAIGVGFTNRGTLWWSWTAPANGLVSIDNLGCEPYSSVSLHVGNELNSLLPVRRATRNAGDGAYSIVRCQVAAGTTYQIALSVPGGVIPEGNVNVNLQFEANSEVPGVIGTDDFNLPHELVGFMAHGVAQNLGANSQPGEPRSIGDGSTVWWSWTAPADGPVIVDTLGSDFDTTLHVFTGQFVTDLFSVASNNNYNGHRTARAIFNAQARRRYHIAVAGNPAVVPRVGNVDLHLYQPGAPDDRLHVRAAVEVELFTLSARRYQLQKSPDLVRWEDVGGPFDGTDSYVSWFFSAPPGEREFYRAKPISE